MPERERPTTGQPPGGFDALVSAHSAAIFAYLWRMLRDSADAEDCLQDTFLRAYRAYGRLASAASGRGHTNPRAWLYRIATNVARTRLKQRGREAARTVALDAAQAVELAAAGRGPAEQASHNARLAAVAAAVEALPHHQRAALILRQYQGLGYDQVAAILECSPESARASVAHGMRKVREVIGNW